ncbi:MAG TPA: hypothetical protein VGR36_04820 [Candidatus Acidoferrales bacterium]|nr:hypothetical protein [Candidatus Acidoferrales bacterium]
MTRRIVAVCALFVLAAPCFGKKDNQFHALVKTIEKQYGVRHTRIPFLGLATFCMRVGHVPGAAGFKLAVFENLPKSDIGSNDSFQTSVEKIIGSSWHPFVRERSRDNGSVTMIYTYPDEENFRLLIVSIDGTEATVVQAELRKEQIWKWMSQPEDAVQHDGKPSAHAELAAIASSDAGD